MLEQDPPSVNAIEAKDDQKEKLETSRQSSVNALKAEHDAKSSVYASPEKAETPHIPNKTAREGKGFKT